MRIRFLSKQVCLLLWALSSVAVLGFYRDPFCQSSKQTPFQLFSSCKISPQLLHGDAAFWQLPSVIYVLVYWQLTRSFIVVFSNRAAVRATDRVCVQRNFTGTVLCQ